MKRLTMQMLKAAEKKHGVARGWLELCSKGYLPEEVAIYTEGRGAANDVRHRVRQHANAMGLPIPATCSRLRPPRTPRKPKVQDFREAFRSSVMRTGLALVLTQPMLESLCAIADDVPSDRTLYFQVLGQARPNNWIATNSALEKRGLIDDRSKLTPLGRIVVDLLKEAGVFVVQDAALSR